MPGTHDTADGRRCNRCGKPVHRTESGAWRCDWCRNRVERPAQRRNQRKREDAAELRAGRANAITGDDNGELSEDEARELVELEGPDAIDCGDDFAMAVRIGATTVTTEDLVTADKLWTTGEAPTILKRAGISSNTFGRMAGCTGRMVSYWLAGDHVPTHSKHRAPAAAALLAIKAGVDESNAQLRAHNRPTTIEAQRAFEKDHAELWETGRPWDHCDGCNRWRRNHHRIRQ